MALTHPTTPEIVPTQQAAHGEHQLMRRVIGGALAFTALTGGLSACGENDHPTRQEVGAVASAVKVVETEEKTIDNWEVSPHPIENGADFIRAIRGPVGDKVEGHTLHHGDGGFTQAYIHPELGEMYLTFLGDTFIQKATGPSDNREKIDDKQTAKMVRNDLLITMADTGKVTSGVKADAKGGVSVGAFIEVPEEEKVLGHETFFWPASFAVNPQNGDVYLSLTKQIAKTNQDPANPGIGFKPTGDNSLVVLTPTSDPYNPFKMTSYQKLPRLDIPGYWHEMGAMLHFDDRGNLIVFDSLREKDNEWAWGWAMGATSVSTSDMTNPDKYKRWDGKQWRTFAEWQENPMMGAGVVVPASVGMEGSGQITKDAETGKYIVSFKQFSMLSNVVKKIGSENLLSGWTVDKEVVRVPDAIEVPKYKSKHLDELGVADRKIVKELDEKVVSYIGSSFQLHNREWVNLMSFNYKGPCAGVYVKPGVNESFFSPKLISVVANTGLQQAGKWPDLRLEQCLPDENEVWPNNVTPLLWITGVKFTV